MTDRPARRSIDGHMHASSLQSFYETAAGVAGALIGLLFVAVSVAHERSGEDPRSRHQLPAAAALTAFTNALCVSLFGLIENGRIALPAAGFGIAGMLFVFASLLAVVRRPERRSHHLVILGMLLTTFAAQVITGLRNTDHSSAAGVQQTVAILVVVCFLSGIARSWELLGGQRTGIAGGIQALLGRQGRDDSGRGSLKNGSEKSVDEPLGDALADQGAVEDRSAESVEGGVYLETRRELAGRDAALQHLPLGTPLRFEVALVEEHGRLSVVLGFADQREQHLSGGVLGEKARKVPEIPAGILHG
jgi:hypothetical protein